MNDQRLLFWLIVIVVIMGCARPSQKVTSLEIPKPNPTIPIGWYLPIRFAPKGCESVILDGPTTYCEHYEKGWDQFLMEYSNKLHPNLDMPFPCQPFSFTLAEGDGYNICKSKITELEKIHGRKDVLAAIQRYVPSNR